ncbi:barstar family protein [Janibacter sp. G1551]|uniref:barstar family protein n=1 Tax=Janibacter sp. G1551 TaxID=3420440 RepID=UPI003D02AB40
MITRLGPDAELSAIVREAQARGREVKVVQGGADKAGAMAAFAAALDFPDWFGGNLDALFDCLHQVAGDADWDLVWDGTAALANDHPDDYAMLLLVLEDWVEEYPGIGITVLER